MQTQPASGHTEAAQPLAEGILPPPADGCSERRPSTFAVDSAAGFLQRSSTRMGAQWRSMCDNITVEPLLAFFIVPCVLINLAVQNLNLDKACRVNLNYTREVCDAMMARNTANYTMEEQEIQKLVAGMTSWKSILQSGLPGCMVLFWGSWSDRHRRRKPCMLVPIVGELITLILLILCVYFEGVRMEVVGVAETLFSGLSGGWFNMMLGVFSYVSDVTTIEERTFRVGVVNLFITLGIPVGMAFSGILLKLVGFYGVFAIAIVMQLSALTYGTFYVKESSAICAPDPSAVVQLPNKKSMFADFFEISHVVETVRVVFKDGPKKRRLRVITLNIALMVVVGPMYGEMVVVYLFTRYKFNWSELEFSYFSTFNMFASLLGIMFSMTVFSKILKYDDSIVALISSSSKILSCFVYAFAEKSWQLYLGPIAETFNGTSFIALRSIATKLVNSDELGKVNSLLSLAESFMPLLYAPLYARVYAATMDTMPGAFYLMGGALTLPACAIFIWMYYIQKRVEKDDPGTDKNQQILTEMGNPIMVPSITVQSATEAPEAEMQTLLPNGNINGNGTIHDDHLISRNRTG